jgi:uncharacterized protein YifE (UPF0438 family)
MRRRPRKTSETLTEFLSAELPPSRCNDVEHFAGAIADAGKRYDRYDERRADWEKYSQRRARLQRLTTLSAGLATALCSLDVLSRDELESLIGLEKIDQLNGLLTLLNRHAVALGRQTQMRGKPTDHATERWILTMADIFENAFSRPPTVSGSGEDPTARRGRFYRMLELGRPSRFARHGRLSIKHVQTLLKSRKPSDSLADFVRLTTKTAGDVKVPPARTEE